MNLDSDGDEDALDEAHAINLTPFIDVMLVLLIIFMVAAPLSTVRTDVDLPSSNASAKPAKRKPVTLALAADQSLRLDGRPLADADLAPALDEATSGDHGRRINLEADRRVAYGDLMRLMNDLRAAGYLKIALIGTRSGPER